MLLEIREKGRIIHILQRESVDFNLSNNERGTNEKARAGGFSVFRLTEEAVAKNICKICQRTVLI